MRGRIFFLITGLCFSLQLFAANPFFVCPTSGKCIGHRSFWKGTGTHCDWTDTKNKIRHLQTTFRLYINANVIFSQGFYDAAHHKAFCFYTYQSPNGSKGSIAPSVQGLIPMTQNKPHWVELRETFSCESADPFDCPYIRNN